MARSRRTVRTIGALMSTAVIAISGLLVVKPLYDEVSDSKDELVSLQQTTDDKQAQLTTLENGVSNYEEIRNYVDNFLNTVSASKDIESASRSISSAAIPGISIVSFTFGTEENVEQYEVPSPSLQDYSPPSGFSEDPAAEPAEGEEAAAVETFHRVPVQITVTASDYSTLATYLDNLSQQSRLLNVVSVTSTKTAGEETTQISATIYAYAFVYTR